LKRKIDAAKLELIQERIKRLHHKVEEAPLVKMEKIQETAMMALKKELAIDELLQKEELEREEEEEKLLK